MKYSVNIDPRVTLIEPEKHCQFPVFVRFTGEFSEDNCMKFRQELIQAENAAVESKQGVLPIVIESYGGEVYSLLACIDAINSIDPSLKVATIVEGKAMSCGAVLFTCGSEGYRFAGPNATIMIHEVSSFAHGKNEEIKVSAREADRLNDKILEIMSKNCGQPKDYFSKEITSRRHADWYLDAEEAVKHNVANLIGMPKFKVSVNMSVEFDTSNSNNGSGTASTETTKTHAKTASSKNKQKK